MQIEAEATNIPEHIEISIEGLPAGTQILAAVSSLYRGLHAARATRRRSSSTSPSSEAAEALEAELEEAAPAAAAEAAPAAPSGAPADTETPAPATAE